MIFARNDEEKRTKLFRIVAVSATLVILLVGIFFVVRGVTRNPLLGEWESQDADFSIEVEKNDIVTISWEKEDAEDVEVDLKYTIDRKAKTISIRPLNSTEEMKATNELSEEGLTASFGLITATFEYSINNDELTLTERDYGEQLFFTKQ